MLPFVDKSPEKEGHTAHFRSTHLAEFSRGVIRTSMTTLISSYLKPRSTSTHSLMAFDTNSLLSSLSKRLSHMLNLCLSLSQKHPLNNNEVSSSEITYDSNPIHPIYFPRMDL